MNSFRIRLRARDGEHAYRFSSSAECAVFSASVINDGKRFRLVLCPKQKFRLLSVEYTMDFEFEPSQQIFLNGYQSWTYSPERQIRQSDRALKYLPSKLTDKYGLDRYGDGFFYRGRQSSSIHHGYSYAYVRNGSEYTLFGSLAESSGFTVIEFDTRKNAVTFSKDCTGRLVSGKYTALDMHIYKGSEDNVFDYWFTDMRIPAPSVKKMLGYTSWYDHYQDIDEIKIISDLAGLDSMPAKPDVFQIDDGYETFVGDWFDVDTQKFPCGLESIVKSIEQKGLIPGIWLAPFLCERDSKLYRQHPDWLLTDRHGKPVYTGCNWSGGYALDIYNGQVREYIRRVLAHYKQLGFKLFKLDFLYAACMLPRRGKTRGEVMADAMDLLRRELQGCMILGCGVPLASAFGKVDFCRIGCDMTLDYDDKPHMRLTHSERPSTKNTMADTVFRRQLSGRAFLNDPDVFLLRDTNTKLTAQEKKNLAFVNALCGGVLFTSDNCAYYSDEARQVFMQALGLRGARVTQAYADGGSIFVTYELDGDEQTLRLCKG
ncbi:MAG: alpha-galactosidase [Ruminococcus sp.]|nr:alpha-galactosidase [Ruminococcus sp.]